MNCLVSAAGKMFKKSNGDKSNVDANVISNRETYGPQLQTLLPAHQGHVTCLADADVGFCLSGGTDNNVVLYNYEVGRIEFTWSGHSREVTKIAFGKNKSIAVSGSRDKVLRVWKPNRHKSVLSLPGHELVITGLAINRKDDSVICSGSRDNSLKLWDLVQSQCIATTTLSRNLVTHLTWSSTCDLIVQTSEDKEVKVWDPHNLQIIHSFPKKQHIQTCCDVSADGRYCVSTSNGFSGNGCEATLWDLRQLQVMHEYRGHENGIETCLFLKTNTDIPLILTAGKDETLRVWQRDSPICNAVLPLDGTGTTTALASPTPDTILVGTFKRGIQLVKVLHHGVVQLERSAEF